MVSFQIDLKLIRYLNYPIKIVSYSLLLLFIKRFQWLVCFIIFVATLIRSCFTASILNLIIY